MRRDVLIVGGGYAGLFAARRLSRQPGLRVRLVDPREGQVGLPMLPDCIGRALPPTWLCSPFSSLARRWSFEWVRDEVLSIDPERRTAVGRDAEYQADAVLLTCGLGPTSCPFDAPGGVWRVSDPDSVTALRTAFLESGRRNWAVAGGGYTGVETATQLWRAAQVEGLDRKLFVIERGDSLCKAMGAPFSEYAQRAVSWLGIEVMTGTRILDVQKGDLLLEDDRRIRDAGLVWAVGVEGRPPVRALDVPQTPNGRLTVDPMLRVERLDGLFAAGDAAAFDPGHGRPLRPSVQAAVGQGRHAAENILRHFQSRPLRPYRHRDLGYVLPLGNGRGCGVALGMPLYGRLPMLLHAIMCVYRSFDRRHAIGILRKLLQPPLRT